ncbi:MAG: YbhB/YbcL family Raf kinase inhibitor-like protein [Promethearchaeota archaeon]
MRIWSDDFVEGHPMPSHCAYESENVSPHLGWNGVPLGTQSFALICADSDAPRGDWIHWLIHGIPSDVREICSGAPPPGTEVKNDFGEERWGGPAPPSGTHRYIFTLYALNVPSLKKVVKKKFRKMCEKHMIASAELMGTFTKV